MVGGKKLLAEPLKEVDTPIIRPDPAVYSLQFHYNLILFADDTDRGYNIDPVITWFQAKSWLWERDLA